MYYISIYDSKLAHFVLHLYHIVVLLALFISPILSACVLKIDVLCVPFPDYCCFFFFSKTYIELPPYLLPSSVLVLLLESSTNMTAVALSPNVHVSNGPLCGSVRKTCSSEVYMPKPKHSRIAEVAFEMIDAEAERIKAEHNQHDENISKRRKTLDQLILYIVREEDSSTRVTHGSIKERLKATCSAGFATWALERIPPPSNLRICYYTTELALALRRLVQNGHLQKATQRSYMITTWDRLVFESERRYQSVVEG